MRAACCLSIMSAVHTLRTRYHASPMWRRSAKPHPIESLPRRKSNLNLACSSTRRKFRQTKTKTKRDQQAALKKKTAMSFRSHGHDCVPSKPGRTSARTTLAQCHELQMMEQRQKKTRARAMALARCEEEVGDRRSGDNLAGGRREQTEKSDAFVSMQH